MPAKFLGCAAALSLLLAGCTAVPETNRSVVLSTSGSSVAGQSEAAIFAATLNKYRAERGRAPLSPNPELTRAARAHAVDMAEQSYFSHRAKDGTLPKHRIRRAGYRNACATGENLAFGQRTAQDAFRAWVKSPGHNRVMLYRDFEEYGFARHGKFWVLNVGQRC